MMADAEFIEQLRRNLPRLLREHPEVRHELWGMMLEVFPSRQEFMELLQEMRALREDTNRRFEAVDRRFEELRLEMDRRFEAIMEELRLHRLSIDELQRQHREMTVGLSSLGIHVGFGLEQAIQGVVEEFAGGSFPFARRLVLRDEAGEVYGIAGAEVEFDLYVHNGRAYLVEVKSHLNPTTSSSSLAKSSLPRAS
jgi:hypothetical protein